MIQGLLQGFTFPACHAALGLWAPLSERSKLTVLIYSGWYKIAFASTI